MPDDAGKSKSPGDNDSKSDKKDDSSSKSESSKATKDSQSDNGKREQGNKPSGDQKTEKASKAEEKDKDDRPATESGKEQKEESSGDSESEEDSATEEGFKALPPHAGSEDKEGMPTEDHPGDTSELPEEQKQEAEKKLQQVEEGKPSSDGGDDSNDESSGNDTELEQHNSASKKDDSQGEESDASDSSKQDSNKKQDSKPADNGKKESSKPDVSEKKQSDQQKAVKQEGEDSKDTAEDRQDGQQDSGEQFTAECLRAVHGSVNAVTSRINNTVLYNHKHNTSQTLSDVIAYVIGRLHKACDTQCNQLSIKLNTTWGMLFIFPLFKHAHMTSIQMYAAACHVTGTISPKNGATTSQPSFAITAHIVCAAYSCMQCPYCAVASSQPCHPSAALALLSDETCWCQGVKRVREMISQKAVGVVTQRNTEKVRKKRRSLKSPRSPGRM